MNIKHKVTVRNKGRHTGIFILFCLLGYTWVTSCSPTAPGNTTYLFAGTYTGSGSNGIHVYGFNNNTGVLRHISETRAENPSFLAVSANGRYVYAVNENNPAGELSAFAFDTKFASLRFLNKQSTGGGSPCYVALSADGNYAAVANYMGGSLALFPIEADGKLGPALQIISHRGKSIVPGRQEAPHVHTTVFSPDNSLLLVTDLGTDELYAYPIVQTGSSIRLDTNAWIVKTTPGAGPRHVVFHPVLPIWYVMEELSGQVAVYQYGKQKAILVQTLLNDTINPPGKRGSADIHLSPDARFLYASNRAEANNIGHYAIDPQTGRLSTLSYTPTGGRKPRNFTISKNGRYLLAANQETGDITTFRRDTATGMLTPLSATKRISKPVCLVWYGGSRY